MCTLIPSPLLPVTPEAHYTPKCQAFFNANTFQLILGTSVLESEKVTVGPGLHDSQVSSLIRAWRQGLFCGQTGEELSFRLNTYGNLAGVHEFNLF